MTAISAADGRTLVRADTELSAALAALPAVQQPQWGGHPVFERARTLLRGLPALVTAAELDSVRGALAAVAEGEAALIQLGDCAESLHECTQRHTAEKLAVLDLVAAHTSYRLGLPVVRVGRIGGQFAKPRSHPTELFDGAELPVFRGHLINSEIATPAARRHDPRRMLWAYEAGAKVAGWARSHRDAAGSMDAAGTGPWTSHEALVIDYESSLLRVDGETATTILGSTHIPWVGDRTRQPDGALVRMLAAVGNPVACKVGPSASPANVLELCRLLDPDRTPGRLTLIIRMGARTVAEALPPVVAAVRRAGHPVVWLCDPMHGNTVRASTGVKTRRLPDIIHEAQSFRTVLERRGLHPGGLHLEVAAAQVTECVGGTVTDDDSLTTRYATLCDPRLNPDQALELIDAWT